MSKAKFQLTVILLALLHPWQSGASVQPQSLDSASRHFDAQVSDIILTMDMQPGEARS